MAGTVTFTHDARGPVGKIVATCTADAADGSFPATAIPRFSGRLLLLQTNPSAVTAPQANYDIVLNDEDSVDRLQGLGVNRHTSTTESVVIVYTSTSVNPPVASSEILLLTITGNNVNSAITVVSLFFLKG